jgi:hypothetical protein
LKNIEAKFVKMFVSVLISSTVPVSSRNHWQLFSCSHIIKCFLVQRVGEKSGSHMIWYIY